MGLTTTLWCALFFLAYLLLLCIQDRNYDTAGKYGLLSHAACLANDTFGGFWTLTGKPHAGIQNGSDSTLG